MKKAFGHVRSSAHRLRCGRPGRHSAAQHAPEAPARGNVPVFELCHTDLTAIITGPDAASNPIAGCFARRALVRIDNPVYPRPWEPYREFAIMYHDLIGLPLAQPFNFGSISDDDGERQRGLRHQLRLGGDRHRDLGQPIRRRAGGQCRRRQVRGVLLQLVGGGDPAIMVDVPANATAPVTPGKPLDCSKLNPTGTAATGLVPQPKATVAFYPDDPSNVYHSYLNDRVKFRILHAGPTVTHVHHQHAHQWLRTPASNDSKLLDSQTITPGDAIHARDDLWQRQPQPDAGRLDLPLPLLPAFRGGAVGAVAGA